MAHVNMRDDDPGVHDLQAGVFPVCVADAREKNAKKPPHDPYFNLALAHEKTREPLCYVVVMLAGKGRGIGKAALKALGIGEDFEGELVAAELIGRRAWAALHIEEYDGQQRLAVDIKQGDRGWWHWDNPPPGALADLDTPLNPDDTPF